LIKDNEDTAMKTNLGWLMIVLGIVLFVSPIVTPEWFGHYVGLVGLLSIFVGVSLLKKRKDQLMK
jgi:uncharacterized membrane protein HdeD (DUF308 family)